MNHQLLALKPHFANLSSTHASPRNKRFSASIQSMLMHASHIRLTSHIKFVVEANAGRVGDVLYNIKPKIHSIQLRHSHATSYNRDLVGFEATNDLRNRFHDEMVCRRQAMAAVDHLLE